MQIRFEMRRKGGGSLEIKMSLEFLDVLESWLEENIDVQCLQDKIVVMTVKKIVKTDRMFRATIML